MDIMKLLFKAKDAFNTQSTRQQNVDQIFERFKGTRVPFKCGRRTGPYTLKTPLHGHLADNSVQELSELFKTAQDNGYKVRVYAPRIGAIAYERGPSEKDCVDVILASDGKVPTDNIGNWVVHSFRIG